RDDQVRIQRLSGNEDLVYQRDRQHLRARGRRRHSGDEGHGARRAHRCGLPAGRSRVRRQLFPQGHGLTRPHRRDPRVPLRHPARGRGCQRRALRALLGDDRAGPRAVADAEDCDPGSRIQAEYRRHAGGEVRRSNLSPRRARCDGLRLRPGRHSQRAQDAANGRRVRGLSVCRRHRRGRDRAHHGMERVQVPEPGALADRDAASRRLRRSESLGSRAHAAPGLRVLLDRPQARSPTVGFAMRVLVTGGAGFIGSHLCEFFLRKGWDVVCMDDFVTGSRDNLAAVESRHGFTLIEHDVTEYIRLDGHLDWVLHFASPPSPLHYLELPIQTLKVGALGTHNALGVAKAKGARFLLASTSEVYGDPLVHPQRADHWGHVNPVGPRGVYDEAKRFGEAITMAYHRTHRVDTRIVRIFNTFGPRMRLKDGRAIPAFMGQALTGAPITVFGDGAQTRSFQYITDLIEGLWRLMQAPVNDPVNIGNPQEMTLLELAKRIIRLTGSRSEIVFRPLPVDDPKVRQPDITRARALLGWEPRVETDEG